MFSQNHRQLSCMHNMLHCFNKVDAASILRREHLRQGLPISGRLMGGLEKWVTIWEYPRRFVYESRHARCNWILGLKNWEQKRENPGLNIKFGMCQSYCISLYGQNLNSLMSLIYLLNISKITCGKSSFESHTKFSNFRNGSFDSTLGSDRNHQNG